MLAVLGWYRARTAPREPHRIPAGAGPERRPGRSIALRCSPRRLFAAALAATLVVFLTGCATAPPKRQGDICAVFEQHPDWYDHAPQVRQALGYSNARPNGLRPARVELPEPREAGAQEFWFIPLGRPSSAKGYATGAGSRLGRIPGGAGRALPEPFGHGGRARFHRLVQLQDLARARCRSKRCPQSLSRLSRGRGGYRRGTWKNKPGVQRTAARVAETHGAIDPSSPVANRGSAAMPGIRYGLYVVDHDDRQGGTAWS